MRLFLEPFLLIQFGIFDSGEVFEIDEIKLHWKHLLHHSTIVCIFTGKVLIDDRIDKVQQTLIFGPMKTFGPKQPARKTILSKRPPDGAS